MLPHQFGRAEQQRRFPTAVPAEEVHDEEDQTSEAELADQMPLLEKRPWDSFQSRVMSKPRRKGLHPSGLCPAGPGCGKGCGRSTIREAWPGKPEATGALSSEKRPLSCCPGGMRGTWRAVYRLVPYGFF